MIDGLTQLMSLSLDRTPPADSVQITAATWINATTVGRDWDQQRDTRRIRSAFATLQATSDKWPSPRQFLAELPHVEQRAMGYEVKPLSPAEADARVAAIRQMLDEAQPFASKPVPRRLQTTTDRAATEAELSQHYNKASES
jgi:hypothetical protein